MFAGCLLEVSMARVLVGTSGWSYASWRGPFFPTGLPAKRHLEYYASQFETVELNGVFYRVGEHRRAFRNMGLRCADKLSLLGCRSLSKHARCSVDK